MANINVFESHNVGSELFIDSENFLQDLNDENAMAVQGGQGDGFPQYLNYGQKFLEYGLNGFAINNIVSIVKTYTGAVGMGAAPNGNGGAPAPNGNGGAPAPGGNGGAE
ncbi:MULTISPECIES: hypothetical protein [unclassified Anabaena]|uniref:hypothetical protein n=1 Tax=unclassified Anabaena TaxID=2619674 RepID=UPI0008359E83|nr:MULTISPECIES: hypothetical protein [unclassified Anabaena]